MNVPRAVNTTVWPAAGFGVVVLIVIAVSGPVFTVIVDVAVRVPELAVMIAVPGGFDMLEAAVTKPPLLTVATAVADEVQVALPVRFWVLPSSKVPVALICWVAPWMIVADVGATASEVSVGFTKKPRQPMARMIRDSVAKVAARRSISLKEGMMKISGRRTLCGKVCWKWLPRIVAEKVLDQLSECTSVCTKVCSWSELPRLARAAAPDARIRQGNALRSVRRGLLVWYRSSNCLGKTQACSQNRA